MKSALVLAGLLTAYMGVTYAVFYARHLHW